MNAALALTPAAFTKGHLWRLVTSLIDQGQFFALLFVILMLALQGPSTERGMGSLRFLMSIVIFGIVVNICYATVAVSALERLRLRTSTGDGFCAVCATDARSLRQRTRVRGATSASAGGRVWGHAADRGPTAGSHCQ